MVRRMGSLGIGREWRQDRKPQNRDRKMLTGFRYMEIEIGCLL